MIHSECATPVHLFRSLCAVRCSSLFGIVGPDRAWALVGAAVAGLRRRPRRISWTRSASALRPAARRLRLLAGLSGRPRL